MVQKRHILLFFLLFFSLFVHAQTVWNGPTTTFTKAGSVDWTQKENQDRITNKTWLTRANTQGLFNIAMEPSYDKPVFNSPVNTEWATGTLANHASLTYSHWRAWTGNSPANAVGKDAVLHLIDENIYIGIKFLSWGGPASGGSFSYQRTTAGIVAPVKLTSFTASRKNSALALQWKTASEGNAASFTIERSADGKDFTAIGTVAAAGNSNAEKTYSFTDLAPLAANFYRLRTTDNDGSFSYSNILAYKLTPVPTLQLFPNPANSVLHLQYKIPGQAMAQIFDPSGRIVKKLTLASGENAINVDVSNLKAGLYLLKLGDESKTFMKE